MRGLIYQARALFVEILFELAFRIAPRGVCKVNVAKLMLGYAEAAKKELKKDVT